MKRVVYASSSSVYGANKELPKREDMVPQPISPYAVAKLTGKKYCHVFSRTYGLETVALRYFNVFGPRQDPKSEYAAVIPKFIVGMMEGQELTLHGDGTQSRDFTYVSNVVAANLLAIEADGVSGEVIQPGVWRELEPERGGSSDRRRPKGAGKSDPWTVPAGRCTAFPGRYRPSTRKAELRAASFSSSGAIARRGIVPGTKIVPGRSGITLLGPSG